MQQPDLIFETLADFALSSAPIILRINEVCSADYENDLLQILTSVQRLRRPRAHLFGDVHVMLPVSY